MYHQHSGYPGGIHTLSAAELREKHPDRIVRFAVEGMLPKNRLGRALATKLKVYAGGDHPHTAQSPEAVVMNG
jgi:large subunit ribosomal protein L13